MCRRPITQFIAVASCALLFQACASTVFTSTWVSPEAARMAPAGKKVAAVAMVADEAVRRSTEDALANELTALGAQGVAGYTILSNEDRADEATAKSVLERAGVAGVVIVRPIATERRFSVTPSYSVEPYYRTVWGAGYWRYGWGNAWTAPEVRTDTIVAIETLLYSISGDTLVWAGRSETQNPERVDTLVRDVVAAVVRELKKAGLL